jgi:toxin YoeB
VSQGINEEPIQNSETVSWRLIYTKQAQKDAKKLASSKLKEKAEELLVVLKKNPFQNPPPYEKLVGDLLGAYSRRINIQHRLVYEVIESEQVVKIIRMWTHYE